MKTKNIKVGSICVIFSFMAAFSSYYNFFVIEKCTYGGSKLSWLFAIICETVGNTGIAITWLILSILAFTFGIKLIIQKSAL
jgi:hypothetical protein